MAVIIGEVELETIEPVTQPAESQSATDQTAVSEAEKQLLETLALIEQRKQRLQFD